MNKEKSHDLCLYAEWRLRDGGKGPLAVLKSDNDDNTCQICRISYKIRELRQMLFLLFSEKSAVRDANVCNYFLLIWLRKYGLTSDLWRQPHHLIVQWALARRWRMKLTARVDPGSSLASCGIPQMPAPRCAQSS